MSDLTYGQQLSEHILKKVSLMKLDLLHTVQIETATGGTYEPSRVNYMEDLRKIKKLLKDKHITSVVAIYRKCPLPPSRTQSEPMFSVCTFKGETITYADYIAWSCTDANGVRGGEPTGVHDVDLKLEINPKYVDKKVDVFGNEITNPTHWSDFFKKNKGKGKLIPEYCYAEERWYSDEELEAMGIIARSGLPNDERNNHVTKVGAFDHEERILTDREIDKLEAESGGMVLKRKM